VLTQPQGLLSIHQHEAEHHLDAQQQRVKVPIDGRLVQQLNMIAGRNAAEGRHTLAVQIPGIFIDQVIIIVIQNGGGQGEGPILELLRHPVIGFSILPLEAHGFRHGFVRKGHGQRHHCSVPGHAPAGLNALLDQIQLVKGIEQRQIVLGFHGFCLDEVILRQIDCLIVHKGRRGGQCRHQPQQTVVGRKFQNGLLHLVLRTAVHHQHSHVQRIQHDSRRFLQGIIDIGLGILPRCDVPLAVCGGFQFIAVIPYPMGTGLLKEILHGAVPLNS